MKNINTIFLTLFVLCSCSDLDRFPLSNLSEATFWQSADDVTLAVNGVYNVLADNRMYRDFFIQTDGISNNMLSAYSFDGFLEISENRAWDASSPVPRAFWAKAYEGIVRANEVIVRGQAVEMDAALKTRLLGEVHFLRALFYFHLTNLWGDVPLIQDLQTVGEKALVSRDPKATVVAAVFQDLEVAINSLPETYPSSDLGRVTKGAALALKSRVHLYQQQYAEVISAVNAVTQLGYDLVPMDQWPDQFLPEGENNEIESIFEVQFSGNTGSGTGSNFNGNAGIPEITGGGLLPTQDLVEAFEEGDPRKTWSVLLPGDEFAGVVFSPDGQDSNFGRTGFARKKGVIPQPNIGGEGDQNAVVIRYAEMLLNLAEAENELNGPAGAYDPINKIRTRVGLPELPSGMSKEDMRAAIKQERRVELAFEGLYYFDLLRWGPADMQAAMESVVNVPGHARFFDMRVMLWPVPQTELDVNPNLLPQNPGW